MQSIRRRMGPVGLSLVAAALTATAFAAVSVAAKDDGGKAEKGAETARERGPEMRGAPPELSEEDEAKLEEFRRCMEDNGAPAPPSRSEMEQGLRNGERPDPPSEEEMEQIRKAHEACADKLPEGLEHFGGPGGPGCGPGGPGGPGGPPPGAQEGTAAPAPPGGGPRTGVEPAPQGATS